MKFTSLLTVLRRRGWIVVLTVLIALGAVYARTIAITPVYQASTVLRVATSAIGSFDFLQYDLTYTDRLMNTYAHVALSSPVISQLMERLDLTTPPVISVEPIEDTELMRVVVEDSDPERAARGASVLADILVEQIEEMRSGGDQSASEIMREQLDTVQAELDTARDQYTQLAALYADTDERVITANRAMTLKEQIYATLLDQYEAARASELVRANSLSVVEPATVPTVPASPNLPLNLGLGAVVGLAVGIALALVFENADTTLHSSHAIEEIVDLDVLGTIPQGRGMPIMTFANGTSAEAEAYRSLRTTLFGLHDELGMRSIVFTSAVPNEGKSTVVANLANAIAQSGRTVIAIDADLRRPTLDKLFGVSSDVGLVNLLRKECDAWEAMVHTDQPNLRLITAGHPLPKNPSELLSSLPIADVIDSLLTQADIVLIDAPALGPVTDAAVIAPLVDATVLIVGRGRVREEDVRLAYRRLVQVKAKSVGVVINRSERSHSYVY